MVLYVLAMLPLVEAMREEEPGLLQPWYADNGAIKGTVR